MTYYSPFKEDVRKATNAWMMETYHEDLYLLTCKQARKRPPNRDTREALQNCRKEPNGFNQAATDLLTDIATEAYRLDLALRYQAPNGPNGERNPVCNQAQTPAQAVAALAAATHAYRNDFGLYLAGSVVRRTLSSVAYDCFEDKQHSQYEPETVSEESYYRDEDGNVHHFTIERKSAPTLRETPASSYRNKKTNDPFDILEHTSSQLFPNTHRLPHRVADNAILAAEILSAFDGSNAKANTELRKRGIKGDAKTIVKEALQQLSNSYLE